MSHSKTPDSRRARKLARTLKRSRAPFDYLPRVVRKTPPRYARGSLYGVQS